MHCLLFDLLLTYKLPVISQLLMNNTGYASLDDA